MADKYIWNIRVYAVPYPTFLKFTRHSSVSCIIGPSSCPWFLEHQGTSASRRVPIDWAKEVIKSTFANAENKYKVNFAIVDKR